MTQDFTIIEKSVLPIVERASELIIKDGESMKVGTELLSTLNTWNDNVEEDRKKLTQPLNETLKEINARYKAISEPLKGAISDIRSRMAQYQTNAEKERQEAELALTQRIKPGKGNLSMEKAVEKLAELGEIDKRIIGDRGDVTFVPVRKFEVISLKDLPLEYHLANETMIREEMRKGKELSGVKYWTEQEPRNRRLRN